MSEQPMVTIRKKNTRSQREEKTPKYDYDEIRRKSAQRTQDIINEIKKQKEKEEFVPSPKKKVVKRRLRPKKNLEKEHWTEHGILIEEKNDKKINEEQEINNNVEASTLLSPKDNKKQISQNIKKYNHLKNVVSEKPEFSVIYKIEKPPSEKSSSPRIVKRDEQIEFLQRQKACNETQHLMSPPKNVTRRGVSKGSAAILKKNKNLQRSLMKSPQRPPELSEAVDPLEDECTFMPDLSLTIRDVSGPSCTDVSYQVARKDAKISSLRLQQEDTSDAVFRPQLATDKRRREALAKRAVRRKEKTVEESSDETEEEEDEEFQPKKIPRATNVMYNYLSLFHPPNPPAPLAPGLERRKK